MRRVTGWRRIANAMWSAPNDPQIYGSLEVEATKALAFIAHARAAGYHVTPTHLVGKALATAMRAVPELNVRLSGTRAAPRPSIDIFFITAVEGGSDLSGVKIEDVDGTPVVDIARALRSRAEQLRSGRDREFARTKGLLDRLPYPLLQVAIRASALLSNRLQLDVPSLGLRRSPFGSAMITSVGMFGLPQGFAPISWLYDVPILLLVGELAERPLVIDGAVVARPMLPVCATIDHRYVDGAHLSRVMKAFREYLQDPAAREPPLSS